MALLKLSLPKLTFPALQGTSSKQHDTRDDIHVNILSVDDFQRALCATEFQVKTRHLFSDRPKTDDKSDPAVIVASPTSEECRLLRRLDDDGELDEEAVCKRCEALEILEGRRKPIADRDYTGPLADDFKRIEASENWEIRIQRNRQLVQNSKLRGWQFLHQVIYQGLSWRDTAKLEPWNDQQHAYVLYVEDMGKFWGVKHIRSLKTFSKSRLRELMEQIEGRGWKDVIWVTQGDEDLPRRLKKEEVAKTIDWEDLTGKSATNR